METNWVHDPVFASIAKAHLGLGGQCLVDPIETGRSIKSGYWLGIAQIHDAEFAKRITTTVIGKVHARYRKVQRCLFFRRKIEVGEKESIGINAVPHLRLTIEGMRFNDDSLFAQQALIAFKGHPACLADWWVPRDLIGELIERERPARIKQRQDEVRKTFNLVDHAAAHRSEDRPSLPPRRVPPRRARRSR